MDYYRSVFWDHIYDTSIYYQISGSKFEKMVIQMLNDTLENKMTNVESLVLELKNLLKNLLNTASNKELLRVAKVFINDCECGVCEELRNFCDKIKRGKE